MVDSSQSTDTQRGAGSGQLGMPPPVVLARRARSPSPRPATGGVKTPAQIAGEARVFREQTTPALVRAAHYTVAENSPKRQHNTQNMWISRAAEQNGRAEQQQSNGTFEGTP